MNCFTLNIQLCESINKDMPINSVLAATFFVHSCPHYFQPIK